MCKIDTITEASGAEITVCQPHHASDITDGDELKDQRSSVIVFIISCSRSLQRTPPTIKTSVAPTWAIARSVISTNISECRWHRLNLRRQVNFLVDLLMASPCTNAVILHIISPLVTSYSFSLALVVL
ncbi:hypothetical protein PGTUg99_007074 [Puccinia graminis f. sp. tritici]|uniref:Uncharacterized protein n=1 Tax=Puccinia graminis f. sp. tritici TaxID=56615 RepID=A0A5B0Q3I8_PUCGR|nr:hypothetical protein PGTUg99_007074 [Puccinia graminis f. sp. tritici]